MCAKIELSLLRTEIHPSFTRGVILSSFYGSGNQNKNNKSVSRQLFKHVGKCQHPQLKYQKIDISAL